MGGGLAEVPFIPTESGVLISIRTVICIGITTTATATRARAAGMARMATVTQKRHPLTLDSKVVGSK